MNLKDLQREGAKWREANFGKEPAHRLLLGVVEEVGELAHSHLKQEQGVRTGEDHETKAMDAVGDITVFLAGYCEARGWDYDSIVESVWAEVRGRDWKKHPETGREP